MNGDNLAILGLILGLGDLQQRRFHHSILRQHRSHNYITNIWRRRGASSVLIRTEWQHGQTIKWGKYGTTDHETTTSKINRQKMEDESVSRTNESQGKDKVATTMKGC
jgi:hypothetical protein